MPKYATNGTGNTTHNPVLPATLYPGDTVYLFGTSYPVGGSPVPGQIQAPNDTNATAESVATGDRSIAANFASRPGGGAPPGASVLVIASANPGAMEVDIQLSPKDADGLYATPTGSSSYKLTTWTGPTGPNGRYFAWAEFQPLADFFMTLKVISNPNNVNLLGKVNYV